MPYSQVPIAWLDAMLDGVAIFAAVRDDQGALTDFTWTFVNPAGARTYGRERDQLLGRRMTEVLPGIRESGVFDAYARVVETGEPWEPEALSYADAGAAGVFDVRAWRVGDGFAVTWRDLSPVLQDRADKELSDELFRAAMQHLPDAVSAFRAIRDDQCAIVDFAWIYANAEAALTTGHSAESLVGRTLLEVLPNHGPSGMLARYAELVDTGEPYLQPDLWYEDTWGDGLTRKRCFDVRASRAGDGFVVMSREVTREREQVLELESQRRALDDTVAQLHDAQRLGRLGSFDYDVLAETFAVSPDLSRLWGVADPSQLPMLGPTLVHPEDVVTTVAAWESALERGGQHSYTYRIRRADDDSEVVIRSAVEVDHDAHGRAVRVRGTHQDVTEVAHAEAAARRARDFLDRVLTASPDYTFVTDLQSQRISFGAGAAGGVLGIPQDELLDRGRAAVAEVVHPEDLAEFRSGVERSRAAADGEVVETRFRGLHRDGRWVWLLRRLTPFRRDAAGEVVEVVGVVRDVTDVVAAEERLRHAAHHDALTGLLNRTGLAEALAAAVGRAERTGEELAALYVDLDSFKRVNDSYGHEVGDEVLRAMADRLRAGVRTGDVVARVGGDEFVVLLEPHAAGGRLAMARAESLREALREPVVSGAQRHVVSASIGVAALQGRRGAAGLGQPVDAVLRDADAAMYRAKAMGKDRVAGVPWETVQAAEQRGFVEAVLREALEAHEARRSSVVPAPRQPQAQLSVAFQPVVDNATGTTVGVEALARLQDAEGVAIPPGTFIPVAEEIGLVRRLGSAVLSSAAAEVARWRLAGHDLHLAVNVSAHQARDEVFAQEVLTTLAAYRLPATSLVLELTETALLEASAGTIAALHDLRTRGVGIAIDDFGTGYASLRYLATLPVTCVKVDRSFTAGLPDEPVAVSIVQAVIGLADDLGLDCVVEGVETHQQRDALPAGVHLQGYLLGRPAGAEDVLARLGRPVPS